VCNASSGTARVAVVELYTSQGCSSCPPADRWLSQLPARFDARRVVPLAFHVDYWDDLGWKDPFARAEFSRRQLGLARRAGSGSVYTPEVFVDGRELRDWRDRESAARAIDVVNAGPARASIELAAAPVAGGAGQQIEVTARATPIGAAPAAIDLVLALTQSGQATAVAAGENRGARLLDDHIVRDWRRTPVGDGGLARGELVLPADGPREFALVALAYDARSGELMQALGVPLDARGQVAQCRVSRDIARPDP
jgi:hypothetical protein